MFAHSPMQKAIVLAFPMLLAAMMACGSSSSTASACNNVGGGSHTCVTVEGATEACAKGEAVDSCPTADVLGTCTTTASGVKTVVTFYSTGGVTATEAQQGCTTGTWAAP
jgi:hypothetical protein